MTGHERTDDPVPTLQQPAPAVIEIRIAPRTIWQVVGVILLTLALLWAARAARSLLAMIALSFFLSLALEPVVSLLHTRKGWRRGAAVGVIYTTGVAFVGLTVLVLIPAFGTLAETIADRGDQWLAGLNTWTTSLGFPLRGGAAEGVTGAGVLVDRFSEAALGTALGIASGGVELLFSLATIAMFTFYFTAEAPSVKRAVLRLFTPAMQERIGWTWDQAIVQTGGYFLSRLVLMGINGAGFFITMALVGVPASLALPLAVFGGFVSVFIPAVGTYLGAAVPVLLTLAIRGLAPGIVVALYALVYQQVENYVLNPRISANTMSLNGGVAFGAALAGGAIAGPIGAFVALPVAALVSSTISTYARSHEVVYGETSIPRRASGAGRRG